MADEERTPRKPSLGFWNLPISSQGDWDRQLSRNPRSSKAAAPNWGGATQDWSGASQAAGGRRTKTQDATAHAAK